MRPVNIKKLNYKDELGRRHRRAFILKIVVMVLGAIAVVAGIIYLLFFSRLFDIREVSFNGLDTVSSDEFRGKIDENLNQKIFGYFPRKNNLFLVNTGNFEKEFVSEYPVFKSVDIQRKLLHGLVLNFLERKPVGVWCFKNNCSYFDSDKVLWGQPGKSSGFIFLTIEDQRKKKRKKTAKKISQVFFPTRGEVAKGMGNKKNCLFFFLSCFFSLIFNCKKY